VYIVISLYSFRLSEILLVNTWSNVCGWRKFPCNVTVLLSNKHGKGWFC